MKRTLSQQIAAAVRATYQGHSQLGLTIAHKVFTHLKPFSTPKSNYQTLRTKREIEIVKLAGQSKNNQEIAQLLHLTEGTVKNNITAVFSKLEFRDRIQAVLWAQEHLL